MALDLSGRDTGAAALDALPRRYSASWWFWIKAGIGFGFGLNIAALVGAVFYFAVFWKVFMYIMVGSL